MERKLSFTEPPREQVEQMYEDMRQLLSHRWGRRLAYRILYQFCNLGAPTFDMSIKDGNCAAQHSARGQGMQAVGHALREALQIADSRAYSMSLREEADSIDEMVANQKHNHQGTET